MAAARYERRIYCTRRRPLPCGLDLLGGRTEGLRPTIEHLCFQPAFARNRPSPTSTDRPGLALRGWPERALQRPGLTADVSIERDQRRWVGQRTR